MEDIVQYRKLGEVAISTDVIISIILKIIDNMEEVKKVYIDKKISRVKIVHKQKDIVLSIEKDDDKNLMIKNTHLPLSLMAKILS